MVIVCNATFSNISVISWVVHIMLLKYNFITLLWINYECFIHLWCRLNNMTSDRLNINYSYDHIA